MAGSLQECMNVAHRAGFTGDKLDIICSIAGGESGWRSDAIAKDDGGPGYPSVGYFQINTKAHFDKIPGGTVDEKVANLIANPQLQADLAYTISGGGANFRPWTVYNTGAWQAFYPQVKAVVPNDQPTATGANQSRGETDEGQRKGDALVAFVTAQVGKPYVWGGGRDGDEDNFDCSGLTWAAYQTIGIDIGGDAWVQSTRGSEVAQPWPVNARPGDLLFSRGPVPAVSATSGPGPEHVAFYIGNGEQVDARGRNYGVVRRTVPWESITGVRRYVDVSTTGTGGWQVSNPLDSVTDAVKALGQMASVTAKAGLWLSDPRNWVRTGEMALGGILIIVGLVLMVQQTRLGRDATAAAMAVATKGASAAGKAK